MITYIQNNMNTIANNIALATPVQRLTFLGASTVTYAAGAAASTLGLVFNGADLANAMCYHPSGESCIAVVTLVFAAGPMLVSLAATGVFYKCIIPIAPIPVLSLKS